MGLNIDVPFRAEHSIAIFSGFKAPITYIFMLVLGNTPKITLERHFSLIYVTLDHSILEFVGR